MLSLLPLILAVAPGLAPAQTPTAAAAARRAPAPEAAARRLLVHGGRIRLGDGAGTVVESLLVEDGVVVAVGPEEEVRAALGNQPARDLDLAGAIAVPGLQDAHVRLEELGATLTELDLRDAGSLGEVERRVAARAAELEPGAWIVGRGWDPARLALSDWPDAAFLSAAAPEHPVLLWSADRRAALASARALEEARIGKEQLAPSSGVSRVRGAAPKGRVVRDAEGKPTGLLLDEAIAQVAALVPEPTGHQRVERILLAQDHLLSRGVTCVHDMGTRHDALELYRALVEDGRLRLRLVCYLDAEPGIEAARIAAAAVQPDARDRLVVAGIAIPLDGSVSTWAAALEQPYADRPSESGALRLTEVQLAELVTGAAAAGLQPAVRATGDRSARLALDTYRKVAVLDRSFPRLRPRVEDGLLVSPRDWPRFPELGSVLCAVPRRLSSEDAAPARVGDDRWRRALAWRRLAPHLGPLALGSGAPEGEASPLRAIAAARAAGAPSVEDASSFLPEELPDGRLALAGCTSGAAWAARQDERRGRLLPGYGADLTVLSVDPVECAPAELGAAQVLAVVVNGEVVGGQVLAAAGPAPR